MYLLFLLQGAYPAKLCAIFVVSAPFWFRATLALLVTLLKPKIRDRLHTITVDELQAEIPPQCLPPSLRGNYKVDHYAWLAKCMRSYKSETGREDISDEGDIIAQRQTSRFLPPMIPDSAGMNIEDFMSRMKDMGPVGIKGEYNEVKQQPLAGKFLASR